MSGAVEKLTAESRAWLEQKWYGAKALRIIDQLTAALEAAERRVLLQADAPELVRSHEALQARVAELEREVESSDAGRDSAFDLIEQKNNELDAAHEALETAESELADLRGRVERAIDAITSARLVTGSAEAAWAKTALEALSNA